MKSYQKICFLILILFVACSPLFAQKKKTTTKSRTNTTPTRKTADARLVPPEARKYNHSFELKTEYDRFEDQTMVTLRIPINSMETMYFALFFKGEKIKQAPKNIVFQYFGNSSKFTFPVSEFIVLTDRDRFRIKMVQLPVLDNGKLPLMAAIDYPTFLRIANGVTVEMKIGQTELFFDEQSLEALKDFASRTNLKANRDSELAQTRAIEKEVREEAARLMRLTPKVKAEIRDTLEKIDLMQQAVKKLLASEKSDSEIVGLLSALASEIIGETQKLPEGIFKRIVTDSVSDTTAAFIIFSARRGDLDQTSESYKNILKTALEKYNLNDYPEAEQPAILLAKGEESFALAVSLATTAKIIDAE